MANSNTPSLGDYLQFYRDLGFEELHLPGFKLRPEPARAESSQTAVSPARPAPAAPLRTQPPAWNYQPIGEGASAAGASAANAPRSGDRDEQTLLSQLRESIGECTRCALHRGRTKIVFGCGNPAAKLVFVGEGPGADEDAQGIPFVGRAGQLLTQMINKTAAGEGIAIQRDDVYICNVVKCRPPGNRAPEPEEMQTCGQFLERQLDAIRPKAICVLGGTAAKYLLRTKVGITKLRGQWKDWRGIPVMPTFHPSFLLRAYNKEGKRQTWEDLKKVLHYVYD